MEGSWRNSASLGSVLRRPAMVVRSFSTAVKFTNLSFTSCLFCQGTIFRVNSFVCILRLDCLLFSIRLSFHSILHLLSSLLCLFLDVQVLVRRDYFLVLFVFFVHCNVYNHDFIFTINIDNI